MDPESITKVTHFLKAPTSTSAATAGATSLPRPLRARRGDHQVSVAHELHGLGRLEDSGGAPYLAPRRRVDADVRPSRALRPYRPAHVGDAPTDHRRAEHCRDRVRRRVGRRECPGPCRGDAVQGSHRAGHAGLQAPPGGARRIHGGYSGPSRWSQGRNLAPIPTGFTQLDELLGNGLQRSDMVVVAARPSLGKSTLAFNIARHAAEQDARVGMFSLEMSAEQIAVRLLSGEANVDSHRLRIGLLSDAEESRILDAIGLLSELPIYIDDTPIQGVVEMRGKSRRPPGRARSRPAGRRLPPAHVVLLRALGQPGAGRWASSPAR